MNINHKMLGDWVMVDGKPMQVAAVHKNKVGFHVRQDRLTWRFANAVEPIFLSAQTLTNSGFEYDENSKMYALGVVPIGLHASQLGEWWNVGRIKQINGYIYNFVDTMFSICYVSDLQHLLRLLRIKHEIKL